MQTDLSLHLEGALFSSAPVPDEVQGVWIAQNGSRDAGDANIVFHSSGNGSINTILQSLEIPVANGTAAFGLTLAAAAGTIISTDAIGQFGREFSGTTDFFGALQVVGLSAYAADGTVITDFDVISDSGYLYTTPVPEPISIQLFLVGIVALAACGYTRRRVGASS